MRKRIWVLRMRVRCLQQYAKSRSQTLLSYLISGRGILVRDQLLLHIRFRNFAAVGLNLRFFFHLSRYFYYIFNNFDI
jgi:hypothetical protein